MAWAWLGLLRNYKPDTHMTFQTPSIIICIHHYGQLKPFLRRFSVAMKFFSSKWACLTFLLACCYCQSNAGTNEVISDPKSITKPVHDSSIDWQPGDPLSFENGLGTFDVQIRERFQASDNWLDFNSKNNARDDTGLQERLRLGLKLAPTDWLTFYAQMEDSRTFFDDSNTYKPNVGAFTANSQREYITNDDSLALRQTYVQFDKCFGQPLSFKAGRQVLSYGDERLVGGFDWDNNARVFDALKLQYKGEGYTVDGFASYVVSHQSDDFDVPDTHDLFGGVYITTDLVPDVTSDCYVFWRSKDKVTPSTTFTGNDNQTEGNPAPDGDYVTMGTRWKSKSKAFGPWDFGFESAIQAGSIVNPQSFSTATIIIGGAPINTGRQDLLAGMAHLEGGYTLTEVDWTPRFFTSLDYASGDSNPGDGTSNTFQNLYPTNHPLYGIMDRFSLQNMEQVTIGITAMPLDNLTLRLDWRNTWLDSTKDEWRAANQSAFGPSLAGGVGSGSARYSNALKDNPSNYVGSEVNLIATYKINTWCTLQTGGGHFFAGSYIRETQPGTQEVDDANFVYSQVQFDF